MPLTGKCFIAHQGNQGDDVLTRLFVDIKKSQPAWRVGAVVPLPNYTLSTTTDKLNLFDPLARFALADPAMYKLDLPFAKRGYGRKYLKYLQHSDPHKKIDEIVEEVLNVQVTCGRNILVSPSLTHGLAPGQKNLRATRRFAQAADEHDLIDGRELMLGLTVHESVLEDDDARNDLLDEIVDWPERPFYLRVCVTAPESYKQYARTKALKGLRAVIESLSSNERRVYLPQTGLVGWLMMPFGASGFGSGISSSYQSLAVRVSSGGNGANRLEWFFLPQFLGFVLRQEVPALAAVQGYQDCPCPYCPKLSFKSGAWNFNDAGLHYLWWCAKLAAEQNGLNHVQKRVADGLQFLKEARQQKVLLDPRSNPTHLEAWSEVVA